MGISARTFVMNAIRIGLLWWIGVLITIGAIFAQDCGDNDLMVYTDDTCMSMHPIPPWTTTFGSNITYRCKSRLQQLPVATLDFCPVELCALSGNWTFGYLSCAQSECYDVGASQNYMGRRYCTDTGLFCQRWDSQSPHSHPYVSADFPDGDITVALDFCRDPHGAVGQPWCYTTDPNVPWEVCGIPKCVDVPIDYGDCPLPVTTEPAVTTCPEPPILPNITYYVTGYNIGDLVSYVCDPGFTHTSGDLDGICATGGIWQLILPVCSILTCPEPANVPNVLKSVSGYNIGDLVKYKCEVGFTYTSGDLDGICAITGFWDMVLPVCSKITGGQDTQMNYKLVTQTIFKYSQIGGINTVRSNLACAKSCSANTICDMYTYELNNCELFTLDLNGNDILCDTTKSCYKHYS